MLSFRGRALLVELFYLHGESATVALQKFRAAKGLNTNNSPILGSGLLRFLKRFEQTGSLQDRS